MDSSKNKLPKGRKLSTRKKNRKIFYICIIILPLLQFSVFYIGVNFNSLLLAFKEYDIMNGTYAFVGFKNFKSFIQDVAVIPHLRAALSNSFLVYFVGLIIGTTLALLFSFYIYKARFMSGVFRVMLFLPQIISSIALVLMFSYFFELAVPALWQSIFKTTITTNLNFTVVLTYTIWSGFGTSILLYSGAMAGISESVVEAVRLEGASSIKEFWFITLPMIYPTLITFVVVGIAGIFINQMNLFNFFGLDAPVKSYTFGYYLYRSVQHHNTTLADYPVLAATGIVLTAVTLPATLIIKWLMEKLGPSTE